jgi:hypothetical protein
MEEVQGVLYRLPQRLSDRLDHREGGHFWFAAKLALDISILDQQHIVG